MINIYRNAMFGDGHITKVNSKNNVQLIFSSTIKSSIEFKAAILNSNVRCVNQHKNAYGKKSLYQTTKTVPVENNNKIEQINKLTIEDFYLWLIDDGSLHKHKFFMNLNSHALTHTENLELQSYLTNVLNIKTRLYTDRKKDGRVFYYQYIPKSEFLNILPEFKQFIITNNLFGYEYKVGLTSETIGYTSRV
jgi:hypothetical protein